MGALAKRVPDNIIEEIKNRTNIVETISRFIDLKRAGSNFKGHCPFHAEKTPSFMVSEQKGIFHCFGCGVGGNVFSFLMKFQGKNFPEVLKELAAQTGVPIPDVAPEGPERETRKDALKVNKFAAKYFCSSLLNEDGKQTKDYLSARGISDEMIELYRIGYSKNSWEDMQIALQKQGVPIEILFHVGLVGKRKKASGFYDRFRDRVMFPIFDLRKNVVGFSGRLLSDKENEAKYLNSPESEVFRKSELLYGLHLASSEIRGADEALIVEGQFDHIVLFQNGIKNVLATLGTALTREHLKILRPMTKNIVFLFDGDEGGRKAASRAAKLCLCFPIGCRVVLMPKGEDPDSYLRSKGADSLRKLIKEGISALEFLIEEVLEGTERGAQDRMQVIETLAPVLAEISDPVARTLYIKELSQRVGVPHDLIESSIGSRGKRRNVPEVANNRGIRSEDPKKQQDKTSWLILEQFLQYPSLCEKISEEDLLDLFPEGQYKDVLLWLMRNYKRNVAWNGSEIVTLIVCEILQGQITASLLADPVLEKEEAEKVVKDCLRKFRLEQLNYLEHDLMQKIQHYSRQGEVEQTAKVLRTYQELIRLQKMRFENQGGKNSHGKST